MKWRSVLLLSPAMIIGGDSVMALGEDHRAFVAASWVSPQSDGSIDFGTTRGNVEVAGALGWSLGGEWRWTRLLGFEVDYRFVTHEIEVEGDLAGQTDISALDLSLLFHFLASDLVDLYGGPTISFMEWGDLDLDDDAEALTGGKSLDLEGKSAWGLAVGADIGVSQRLAVVLGLRWLNQEIDFGDLGEVGVFPFEGRVGLGVRW